MIDVNAPTVRYTTYFPPQLEPSLKKKLEHTSILKRLEPRPPLTLFALEKRAQKDVKEMLETLETNGYFESDVSFKMTENEDQHMIMFHIETGPLYIFSGFDIHYEDHLPSHMIHLNELNLPLKKGDPVDLEKAMDIGRKIAKYWRTQGYPFAKALDMKGIKNASHKSLHLIFSIRLGPKSIFGKTTINGLTRLEPSFVLNRLDYEEGTVYNEKCIDSSRKALIETGLFNEITLQPSPQQENRESSAVPIDIHLKEGPPRRIGGGVKYASSDGFSGRVFWRHDNFLGKGESIETKMITGKKRNEARIAFSKPDYGLKKQTLYTALSGTEDITRAYRSKSGKGAFGFTYDITSVLQLSYGIDYEISKIKRNKRITYSRLLGVPFIGEFDSTNSILNPTEGFKVRIKTNPYVGKYAGNNGFWVNEVFASTYIHPKIQSIEESENIFVLAAWGKAGVISSSSTEYVPPTKRLYSGGGNSVRGYGYQLLGPIDSRTTPIGGLSVIEFGSEARFAITETIGAVVFAEAGSVGLKRIPKMNGDNLLWGTGVGVRYFTGIGPIRFDLSFPMKRRIDPGSSRHKKMDAPFQFYISIGQAF